MKRHWLYLLLTLSLLLNVGVLGAVGYRTWQNGNVSGAQGEAKPDQLAQRLNLSEEQRRQWRQKEERFLREMQVDWEQVRLHRENMIRQIFSPQPDMAAIETARAAICRIQEKQQRHVIAQLMEEQRMLDAQQRETLAGLLIQQRPAGSLEEHLHRH